MTIILIIVIVFVVFFEAIFVFSALKISAISDNTAMMLYQEKLKKMSDIEDELSNIIIQEENPNDQNNKNN